MNIKKIRNIAFLLCCLLSFCLPPAVWSGDKDLGLVGQFAKWDGIELVLTGPDSKGNDPSMVNPFSLVVDMTFTGPSGKRYVIPGFYDGNGQGGLDGAVWKVRFAADELGLWTFVSKSATPELDGWNGSFTVTPVPPEALGFYRWGRLEYTGTPANGVRYMKFRDGPYWLKAGADDPENLLGTMPDYDTQAERKATIDYLAAKGLNSMYMVTYNISGDNGDIWPWIGGNSTEAKLNAVGEVRFDVARLAEWLELFEHMQEKGMVVYVILEDDSAWAAYDHDRYFREMVARFGHLPGLLFNMGEEYSESNWIMDGMVLAERLRQRDPYRHPVAIHNVNNPENFYLDAPYIDFAAIQTKSTDPYIHNSIAIDWINQATLRGTRVPMVGFDEPRPIHDRRSWWSGYLGGAVWEAHVSLPYDRPIDSWGWIWTELGGARAFMESLPFWAMNPDNSLIRSGFGFCLAKPGAAYGLYLPDGGAVALDLPTGKTYQSRWWRGDNPYDGAFQNEQLVRGGSQIFTAPGSGDWALAILADGQDVVDPPPVDPPPVDPPPVDPPPVDPPADGVLFADDFARPDSAALGNGWAETETSRSLAVVKSGGLLFDTSDEAFSPLVTHVFPRQQTGVVRFEFDLGFVRTKPENSYSFHMQLADSTAMSATNPLTGGVAVNLVWGGPSSALTAHETLGYKAGATTASIAKVTGVGNRVTVLADLDRRRYSVSVAGVTVADIPFDSNVAVDTVRFFTHKLNRANFDGRAIDNVLIAMESVSPPVDPPPVDPPPVDPPPVDPPPVDPPPVDPPPVDPPPVIPPDDPNSLHFVAIGDNGSGEPAQFAVATAMHQLFLRDPYPLVVMAGDNIYENGEIDQVQEVFEIPYAPLLAAGVQFRACLGNHDVRTNTGLDQLNYPGFNMGGRHYTFRKGPAEFFVLDTSDLEDWNEQLPWFEQALAASTAPWKIVLTHRPIYNSGKYGSSESKAAMLEPLFEKYGVQLYINGHDHHYERTKPINGTTYLIVGNGGAGLYPNGSSSWTAYSDSIHGFSSIRITGQEMVIEGWDKNGNKFDTATIRLAAAPPPVDPPPVDPPPVDPPPVDPPPVDPPPVDPPPVDPPPVDPPPVDPPPVDPPPVDGNVVLFTDDFTRPDNAAVGNGWAEAETGTTGLIALSSNGLVFEATSDLARRPQARHDLARVVAGKLTARFAFDWARSAPENNYRVQMQLGDSALMSVDGDARVGVAANLVWGSLAGKHETLGYAAGGSQYGLAVLSGQAVITIEADLDQGLYRVLVNDVEVGAGLPFDNRVAIDSIRFFTDGLNHRNFRGRRFDDVRISSGSGVIPPPVDPPPVDPPPVDPPPVDPPPVDPPPVDPPPVDPPPVDPPPVDPPTEEILFADSFDRPDNAALGNGWREAETGAQTSVRLTSGRMIFEKTGDAARTPMAVHDFQAVTSGKVVFGFAFDWTRISPENTYRLYMQLGDRARMIDSDAATGVGVNLLWSRINTADQTLGLVNAGNATPIAVVRGQNVIRVEADLDRGVADVYVNDLRAGSALVIGAGQKLDAVRIFTDALNERNFSGLAFDNLEVRRPVAAP